MRYISTKNDLVLYERGGKIRHKFKNGVLAVGSLTTNVGTGNSIDAALRTDFSKELMPIYSTDLLGATTQCLEMCGLGSLTNANLAGSSLTTYEVGLRGAFFQAPVISTGSSTVPAAKGREFEILTGTVTYAGVTYSVGQVFVSDGSTTTTSGSGTFALSIPSSLRATKNEFRTEQFKINSLAKGDESKSYWNQDQYGAAATASLTSTDADYVGWTRN